MKKLLLTIALIAVFSASAQSRTNRSNASSVAMTEKITKITGWHQAADTGSWREGANYINRADYQTDEHSLNVQNMQFEKIDNGGTEVVGFIYNFKSGHYKYKSIKKGWYGYKKRGIFIFTPEQYKELAANIASKNTEVHILSTKDAIEIWSSKIDTGLKLGMITEALGKDTKYGISKGMIYQYQSVDGVEIIRFRVSTYLSTGKYSPNKLDNSYFEVSLEDFTKLLTLY